jgi:Starch-binding associating with outer membrane
MKQRFKIALLATVVSTFLFTSCEKTLDKMAVLNKNENSPTSVIPSALLTQAELSGTFTSQGGFGDGPIGVFNGHFAGNHATGLSYNQYQLTNGDLAGLFTGGYQSTLMNLKQIITTAQANERSYVGIAQILTAYQLGYMTSIYGDIPWSQALDVVKFPTPKYDAQVDIYAAIQKLLADGIASLTAGASESAINGDFLYGGNRAKWKGLAYMLSARYYNHFSKKDPAGSATNAIAAIANAKAAGFTSSSADFKMPYDGSTTLYNPWQSTFTNGMYVANKAFLDYIMADNDPRLRAFFTSNSGTVPIRPAYGLGKLQDGDVGTGAYMSIGDSTYYGQKNSPVLFATYFEMLFIEAEANMRAGNAAAAATALNAAVAAHLNQVISFTADKAGIPTYIANHGAETAATVSMAKIMTEKYKAMLAQEVETWMDVKRHAYAYPVGMQSIPNVSNTSASKVPVASTYIQRLLYTQSELDKNGTNVPTVTIFSKLPILQ